jgi:hypothetical protein
VYSAGSVKRAREKSLSFYPANTGTNFINDYSWGSFKVHEKVWMEKYFDALLAYFLKSLWLPRVS